MRSLLFALAAAALLFAGAWLETGISNIRLNESLKAARREIMEQAEYHAQAMEAVRLALAEREKIDAEHAERARALDKSLSEHGAFADVPVPDGLRQKLAGQGGADAAAAYAYE